MIEIQETLLYVFMFLRALNASKMCAIDLGVNFTYVDRLEVSLKYTSDMFCTKCNALYIS